MRDSEREQRKTELLNQIQQQRASLSIAKYQWLETTAPYDKGWHTLVNLRRYFVVAGTVLAIWNVRRPGKMMRLVKRGFSFWSAWRVVRTSLNKTRVK